LQFSPQWLSGQQSVTVFIMALDVSKSIPVSFGYYVEVKNEGSATTRTYAFGSVATTGSSLSMDIAS
jgi:hypothetical protein